MRRLLYSLLLLLLIAPIAQSQANLPTGTGWHVLPNTAIQPNGPGGAGDVCPPDASSPFSSNCHWVLWAWNGGVMDTVNKRMIVWGGGHTDYNGNEPFVLDLNTPTPTMKLGAMPTLPTSSSCTAAIGSPPKANSRHTYDGLTYIPTTQQMFITGGSLACSNGTEGTDTWTLGMASLTPAGMGIGTATNNPDWVQRGAGPSGNLDGKCAEYDAVSGFVYVDDRNTGFWEYNTSTGAYTNRNAGANKTLSGVCTIDPIRRLFIRLGGGEFTTRSLTSGGFGETSHAAGGCPTGGSYMGMVYDPVAGQVVIYQTGSNLTIMNTSTFTCTTESYAGGPPAPNGNSAGILGRFQYSGPAEDAFVAVTDINQPAWIIRRRASPQNELPFLSRCATPGMVVCDGLDVPATIASHTDTTGSVSNPTFDSSAGVCSIPEGMAGRTRFQTNGAVNGGGSLLYNFGPYGNNSTFYFTFRQCWDSNFANQGPGWSFGNYKHFIVFHNASDSCTAHQFVLENSFGQGYPSFYRSCGTPDLIIDMLDGDFAKQWGVEGTHGPDTGTNPGFFATVNPTQGTGWFQTRRADNPGENNGLKYTSTIGQWVDFYCKVTQVTAGAATGRLDCWAGLQGQNMKPFVSLGQIIWPTTDPPSDFGHINLLVYITGGVAGTNVGTSWFAQLVVGSNPICPPTGPDPEGLITCNGQAPAASPNISISPSPVTFGSVLQGNSSSPVTVTISNTGTATLTLSSPFFTISGTNPADFSNSGGTCSNGGTVVASSSCTMLLVFSPSAVGARSGLLTINGNATGTANLTGTGTGSPTVGFSPTSLSFGNQSLQIPSSPQNVTLTNTGTSPLTISSITLTGANIGDYSISSNNCGASLAAGNNCIVGITFTPTIVGSRTANLTFTTNAASSPNNVPLTGTGQAPIASFSPLSFSFGGIKVGLSSPVQAITLTNTGNATMSITSITLTGANSTDFSLGTTCTSTLTASSNCLINITFTPILQGLRSASVSVISNTLTSPDTDPFSGTGFLPITGIGTLSGSGTIKVQP